MRIAIVTQYYAPEDARIPTQIARELSERGHSVRVVTAFPSYPQGRIYDGFRQRLRHFERDGSVRVRRVPSILSHSQNPIARVATYLSFAISSAAAVRDVWTADVVYVYATQMTAAIGPLIWRAFGGPPYLLHVQDLWPESVTESALVTGGRIARAMAGIMTPFLRLAYRHADGVLAIAPTMQKLLVERGARPEHTEVVFNWADESRTHSSDDDERTGTTSVVYAGNIGPLQDLETAVAAASMVSDLDGFTLTIVGSGVAEESVRAAVERSGATNVRILGRVPNEEMGAVYASSDFQLVTLRDLPIFRGTVPSKVSASLWEGIPLITNVAGDVTSIVSENGLGVTCEPVGARALADAFRLAHRMSGADRAEAKARCREFYLDNMSLRQGVDAVESALRATSERGRS